MNTTTKDTKITKVSGWWEGTFEDRMKRRAERRARPEFKARLEAIARHRRHREIWRAIRSSASPTFVPFVVKIL
jgi:hypothetical protein